MFFVISNMCTLFVSHPASLRSAQVHASIHGMIGGGFDCNVCGVSLSGRLYYPACCEDTTGPPGLILKMVDCFGKISRRDF